MKTVALEPAVLGSGWTRVRKLQVEQVFRPCSLLGKPECCSAIEVERGCHGRRWGAPRLCLTQPERRLAHPGSSLGLCSSHLLQAASWAERSLGETNSSSPPCQPSVSGTDWAQPCHTPKHRLKSETGCSFKVKFNTQGAYSTGDPRPAPCASCHAQWENPRVPSERGLELPHPLGTL